VGSSSDRSSGDRARFPLDRDAERDGYGILGKHVRKKNIECLTAATVAARVERRTACGTAPAENPSPAIESGEACGDGVFTGDCDGREVGISR
jgi:hypothetical protein